MINIIEFSDKPFESQFVSLVDDAYAETSMLLDKLPATMNIKFTDNGASDITGVGGFSVSSSQLNLAVLKGFTDTATQRKNLRSTVFHECFHVQQGFTFADSPFTALEAAIYEGCALAFERTYADNTAAYGDYRAYSDEELQGWLDEIQTVGTEYFENSDTWHKWAFYHPEYAEKWIIYKVGSWVVDRILSESNLDIIDLKDKTVDEIATLHR